MAVDFVVDAVMTALGLEGNEFQRPTIEFYVDEVNEYLKDAGVPEDIIGTKQTVGIVARGVADLWSYGAGNGKLSIYFKERAIQLASASNGSGGGGSSELPPVTPADDGKVLTVVDGQWAAAEIPDGRLVIQANWVDGEVGGAFTISQTEAELVEALNKGLEVVIILPEVPPIHEQADRITKARLTVSYSHRIDETWSFRTSEYNSFSSFWCLREESLTVCNFFN